MFIRPMHQLLYSNVNDKVCFKTNAVIRNKRLPPRWKTPPQIGRMTSSVWNFSVPVPDVFLSPRRVVVYRGSTENVRKFSAYSACCFGLWFLLQIKHKIELNLTVNIWWTFESTDYSWTCKVILSDATRRKLEREGIVPLKYCACKRLHDVICHGRKRAQMHFVCA